MASSMGLEGGQWKNNEQDVLLKAPRQAQI